MRFLTVAKRDFVATVFTKGFIFGVFILPILMTAAAPLAIMLLNRKPPAVEGGITIIDRTGKLSETLQQAFDPKSIEEWVRSQARETTQKIAKALPADQAGQVTPMLEAAAQSEPIPQLHLNILPPDTDIEAQKEQLFSEKEDSNKQLALLVVEPDAVTKDQAKEEFGAYQMFIRSKLDIRVQSLIRNKARESIINTRLSANGEDASRIRNLMNLDAPDAKTVTKDGDRSGDEMAQIFIPMAFMILLWISVFTGGQFLLTSTIEEKSNRIMEVLLSAVSPLELMVGKILGQMGAGMLILVLYTCVGVTGLVVSQRTHLVDWSTIALVIVYFFLAYGFISCMMAAVGSAVNDIHEAQALIGPLMMIIVAPMVLMTPIIMDPQGTLATTMSFIPGVSPFVMVLRICSSQPPPIWQIAATVLLGAITVVICAKFAAKIFRIGVLMYGKPPNLATFIRWIRMA